MRQSTTSDNRSPWYEAFSPKSLPAQWVAKPSAKQAGSPPPPKPQAPEVDWATEAIFDSYNA
jgi:hypothetical protein